MARLIHSALPHAGRLGPDRPAIRSAGLEVVRASKSFGAIRALDDVSLRIEPGTIHALIGENGAGKSTLGKVISGVVQPDRGGVTIGGEEVVLRSPRDALAAGIATIEQEISLVPGLTVEENVLLGAEPRRAGVVDRRRQRARWRETLARSGFELDGSKLVRDLPLAAHQQVEILRALSRGADLIEMDEPTAALGEEESRALDEDIRQLKAAGTSVLIISHFIKEVLALVDFVTVLRDGRLVRTAPAAEESESSLIQAMLGRPLSSVFPKKVPPPEQQPVVLEGRDLVGDGLDGASISVRGGEIVGVAGLDGSGRLEIGRALFGDLPLAGGEVRIAGAKVPRPTPRASNRLGLSMIPASRRDDGLFLGRPIVENATVSRLSELSHVGFLSRRAETRAAVAALEPLDVPVERTGDAVSNLSGGNQQKVLFARALMSNPAALIALEPTRGIDIGAKASIYSLLISLAASGVGLLLVSSEQEELVGLCHRIIVMHRGRVAAELREQEIGEEQILAAAFGRTTQGKG